MHHLIAVLIESLVAGSDEAPFFAYHAVRLFDDFIGVGQGVSGADGLQPLQIGDSNAGAISPAIIDPLRITLTDIPDESPIAETYVQAFDVEVCNGHGAVVAVMSAAAAIAQDSAGTVTS